MVAPGNVFSLKVGIHCDGCVRDIKKNVEKMEGVKNVKVYAEEDTVVITGTVHPDKVIAMLYKKLKKRAELLQNTSTKKAPPQAVPTNRGADSQIVVVQSPNAAVNLLGDPNMAAQVVGELRRKIPGLGSVEITTQTVTNTIKFSFDDLE